MTVRLKSLRRSPLWYNTDFLVFWGGQSLSQIGSRITREGLPLAAVITLGASPMMMGWLIRCNLWRSLVNDFQILKINSF